MKARTRKTQPGELGRTVGALLTILSLPVFVYYIILACNKDSCSITLIPDLPASWAAFFDLEASLIFIGFLTFQALLYVLPIGPIVLGQPQPIGDSRRLPYRCNGFMTYCMSIVMFMMAVYFNVPVTIVYDKILPLITTGVILSYILAVVVYIKARLGSKDRLSPLGNTGNMIYDFYMGHELNPRLGTMFDMKFFLAMRTGWIGWVLLNLAILIRSYERDKQLDYTLVMVVVLQALYVADTLWFEDSVLSAFAMMHEGFGLMLIIGDLVWMPFMYSIQARYLLEHPNPQPWYHLVGIAVMHGIGWYIFRGSNSQKNTFRRDPDNPAVAHLETLSTGNRKKRLLVSGWWGMCRKPNYLGDIIMSIAWGLPCGFSSATPWFYIVYLTLVLIHRAKRDDEICRQKYGKAWDKYCDRVKYRIIPRIY